MAHTFTGSEYHSLRIKPDGTLWAWGANSFGELGLAHTTTVRSPEQVGSDTNWLSVKSTYHDTVALKTDGTIWGWGENAYGQLGFNNTTSLNSPLKIGVDTNWVAIQTGEFHTLALKSDGTLWSCGRGDEGQRGDGVNTLTKLLFTQIGLDTNWFKIFVGHDQSFAIKTDGTLWAWGDDGSGQLGFGTQTDANVPTQVGTAITWDSISSGEFHTLGIQTDGSMWAWGSNTYDRLGDGSGLRRTTPFQIGIGTLWSQVGAGVSFSVALSLGGSFFAWGVNVDGNFGDGTFTDQNLPTNTVLGSFAEVHAGGYHTLLLDSQGYLNAFGKNSSGQVGNGDSAGVDVATPVVLDLGNILVNVAEAPLILTTNTLTVIAEAIISTTITPPNLDLSVDVNNPTIVTLAIDHRVIKIDNIKLDYSMFLNNLLKPSRYFGTEVLGINGTLILNIGQLSDSGSKLSVDSQGSGYIHDNTYQKLLQLDLLTPHVLSLNDGSTIDVYFNNASIPIEKTPIYRGSPWNTCKLQFIKV